MNVVGTLLLLVFPIALCAWWQSVIRNSGIDPWPTALPHPPTRDGVYAPNAILQRMERIGEGLLPAPEDLTADEHGNVYAACGDGWVKKILPDGKVQKWAKVGGRPLGLVWGLHGELLVCEPSMGLLNVTKQGKVNVLSDSASGIKIKFADGVDVARDDGTIYFTDASTKFGFGSSDLDVLEGRPNGRLLKYDPASRTTSLVLSDLYFPNGVALSSKQDFLVFCETSKVRCRRYWLHGHKMGQIEVFIDNLPGYPDNVHSTGHGTFWISLVSTRSRLFEFILGFPFVKHLFANPRMLERLNVAAFMAKVLEVNEGGEPLRLFEDANGTAISYVTTGLQVGNYLYVGGLASTYVGRLRL